MSFFGGILPNPGDIPENPNHPDWKTDEYGRWKGQRVRRWGFGGRITWAPSAAVAAEAFGVDESGVYPATSLGEAAS